MDRIPVAMATQHADSATDLYPAPLGSLALPNALRRLTSCLKPSLSQFACSGYKILVGEVTQIGLIESRLSKMSMIRGALG